MKRAFEVFLVIVLCICLVDCTSLEAGVARSYGRAATPEQTPRGTPSMEQDNEILSKDYAVAENALNKAVLEKDNATIRLGLQSPILLIRQKTAEVISEIGEETFVPDLIRALRENRRIIAGGSEIRGLQTKLDLTFIAGLEKLTNIEFEENKVSEKPSDNQIEEVIKRSQEWWAKRQQKSPE